MPTVTLAPTGPFSLAAATRFLTDFTPASHTDTGDGTLRLAFPSDDGTSVVAVAVRQKPGTDGAPGAVRADVTVHPGSPPSPPSATSQSQRAGNGAGAAGTTPGTALVRDQLARILSLDVDGSGFPALAADPVVAGLMADHPGLRPVCFHSPYEAAAWAVIGQRVRRTQAAAVKARIAERYGARVHCAGRTLHAFPTPTAFRALTDLAGLPGLTAVKAERLHALAEAALDGALDAARLRALPTDEALAELRALPGVGPFSAELILIRGAGHPDVFPRHEPRLHQAVATEYGLGADPGVDRLAEIAERWRPYRSWVSLLLRTRAQETPRPE